MSKQSFPETIIEFARMFPNDEACWHYLAAVRWPDGFRCPRCGLPAKTFIRTRLKWERPKGHQTTVKSGTVMHIAFNLVLGGLSCVNLYARDFRPATCKTVKDEL